MIILEKPNFPPNVCLTCGVGYGRKWFVSLDFPLDNYFNPVVEGKIFQCNECWESLATEVAKEAQKFLIGQAPWEEGDYIQPTYDNEEELLKVVNFSGEQPREPRTDSHPSGYNQPTELSNPEPTRSDSEPDTTDNDEDDDTVREFRVFFGDDTGGGTAS